MSKYVKVIRYLLGISIIFFLWFIVEKYVNSGSNSFFPTIKGTISRFISLLNGDDIYGVSIYSHLGSSLLRWGKGFTLAMLISIPLGILMGYYTNLFDILIPFITILQVIPGLAWIPIAMLIFGLGEKSTLFIIFITSIPPMILNSAGGIREMPVIYRKVSSMIGINTHILFFKILIPASSLSVITGLRIALASGWRVLIAAEMLVGSSIGLGYVIIQSRWSLDFEAAFVIIILIATIGLVIEKLLFQIIENKIRRIVGYERVL